MYAACQASGSVPIDSFTRKKYIAGAQKEYPTNMGCIFTIGEMRVKEIAYGKLMNCSAEVKKG
jgi:hypothetical protein